MTVQTTPSADVETLAKISEAHTYRGRPPTDSFVSYLTLGSLLAERVAAAPDKTWLIHYNAAGERESLTYAAFSARVNQAANYLYTDLGVRPGDRVATIAYNHSDTVILYFACWLIGAMVAPQNVTEDDARIAFILRNSEAVIALVREEYLERAERIIRGTAEGLGASNIRQIVQVGGAARTEYRHFHTESAVHLTTFTPPAEVSRESESLLVYTSGTTGAPKGVVLTQYNMMADAHGISAWQGITAEQRLMAVLPIHHVNGIIVTLITPLYVGGSVVLNRQFTVSAFWSRIAREGVHIVSVVPTLLQFCCEYADAQEGAGKSIWGEGVSRADLTNFRHLICGAGTLAVALVRRFEDRFGVRVLHGYGLSETTCYSCYLPVDLTDEEHAHWLYEFGYPSIGSPIGVNEMAIFAPDGSGVMLTPGERGEICIRGHNVMRCYYQRPDANRETFKFGWFRSGDEGFYEVDEKGRQFFFITGRLKELINRGGVKFSPFDIEEVLLTLPGVKVGLAVAFENDYYGEEVGAYVVLEEGTALTAEAVIAHCRGRMSFEKSPKVVLFGTEVPVTTTGKYQRLKLRDLFAAYKPTQFKP
ncbi:MAG: acyl--CoA ligase [Anaerolineales bacterium]|nr:acyl--CoA ligase [Anaerolineales bacterium]